MLHYDVTMASELYLFSLNLWPPCAIVRPLCVSVIRYANINYWPVGGGKQEQYTTITFRCRRKVNRERNVVPHVENSIFAPFRVHNAHVYFIYIYALRRKGELSTEYHGTSDRPLSGV